MCVSPVLSSLAFILPTFVQVHPSMMDAEATGNDIAFAGHSDGSVVSFKVRISFLACSHQASVSG